MPHLCFAHRIHCPNQHTVLQLLAKRRHWLCMILVMAFYGSLAGPSYMSDLLQVLFSSFFSPSKVRRFQMAYLKASSGFKVCIIFSLPVMHMHRCIFLYLKTLHLVLLPAFHSDHFHKQ